MRLHDRAAGRIENSPAAIRACHRYSRAISPDVGRWPSRWAIRFRLGTTSFAAILIAAAIVGWAFTRAYQSLLSDGSPVESTFHK